jgi:hypothetical protein
MEASNALTHIFAELRHYEDRARADEETRETRLATLVALSGAVLGLLAASFSGKAISTTGVAFFCLAAGLFVLAILVATQFVIRLPVVSRRFGGRLEKVKEVGLREFDFYLTPQFQNAEKADLQKRVLPILRLAIGSRRRNVARKQRCLDVAVWLIAGGVLATAVYAAILGSMSAAQKVVPDPRSGVAAAAVATTMGQPGGHVLTEDDLAQLLLEGTPFEEVLALELTSPEGLKGIARELVAAGRLPAERFSFLH